MTTVSVKLVRGIMWLVLTMLVLAAVAISGLRFILPQLNDYREPIQQWASEQVEMSLDITHVEGYWRNLGPSLVLQGVGINMPDAPESVVRVGDVSVELDVLRSLLSLSPVFRDLRIDRLSLDLTQLNALPNDASSIDADSQIATINRLEALLFVQLGQFSIRNSDITLQSPAGERLTIDIQQLKWDAYNGQRRAEGIVSIADTHFSQMRVIANLSDKATWSELSGNIYLQARNLSLTPWLNKQLLGDLLSDAKVTSSNLNAQVWLTLENGQLQQSQVALDDSFLHWQLGGDKHQLKIEQGLVSLIPNPRRDDQLGWQVNTQQMAIEADKVQWPALDVAVQWEPERWQVAVNTLSLAALQPLVSFLPPDSMVAEMLDQMQPSGSVSDIRIAGNKKVEAPRFSFNAKQLAVKQWELLPGIHKLNAQISGSVAEGRAVLSLTDDTLPYGDLFQAPLPISQGDVTAYWQVGDEGWRLWSDHLVVSTPHLRADGQFRLDFPADAPAWLSFYGEASASHAGETWRYLPTLALGHELTDYLSTAIRGGQATDAKLLWYGELDAFPYANHDGVLQVFTPIRNGIFSFDTAWPELTDLDLDLLFENDFMYLEGHHAKTMGATASKVTGDAELIEDGHLKLAIDVAAEGKQVRDYMLATPLVDSVGAALTTVQVDGPVSASFKLDIPFDSEDVRAWGSATLANNQVMLDTPTIPLDKVNGTIHFDNDVVEANKITALLLDQPITLGFSGNSVASTGYRVDVDVDGDWQLEALQQKLQDPLLAHTSGSSQWQGKIGVNLHDIGFDYQVDLNADLAKVESQLPYPLALQMGTQQKASLAVTGNKQSLIAKLSALDVMSQVKLNLVPDRLVIDASELAIGSAKLSPMAHGVHGVDIASAHIDGDRWIALMSDINDDERAHQPSDVMPELSLPTRIHAKVRQLTLASLNWNVVDLHAQHLPSQWQISLDSREAKGTVQWSQGKPLNIDLTSLHLNLPIDEERSATDSASSGKYQPQSEAPPVTSFDRSMMANMPALDLQLDDAWLQGYRLGEVSGQLRREGNTLELRNFIVDSGVTSLNLDGHWSLNGDRSETQVAFDIEGKNSSDLMGRFGISGGIQGAEFSTYASIQWQGAPWSMHRETLTGELKSETGQGVISDIGGAGRLLGLFSIDSLIRKMQLDFSGIFDDGLAFNYIRGSGRIDNGVFDTRDIKMQALAGDMFIEGSANLVNESVDAKVKFIPDFTSGIPVLTAFAVAPQTAIYVFAISTVLAPVLDVFTQVNYKVEGAIDAPVVTELSRFTGEYQVPESLKKEQE